MGKKVGSQYGGGSSNAETTAQSGARHRLTCKSSGILKPGDVGRSTIVVSKEGLGTDGATVSVFKGNRGSVDALKVRLVRCSSCNQDSHSFDHDCLPLQILLWWAKTEFNKDAVKVPTGKECGNCNYVRCRHWTVVEFDSDTQKQKKKHCRSKS